MTYRTGTHHGITICREGDGYRCRREEHDCERGHLVAVVVRGFDGRTPEQEADWMCARINAAHTPDVDYLRGAAEALAHVADRIADAAEADQIDLSVVGLGGIRLILEGVAAELGLEEDAPSAPLSQPVSAEQPPAGGSGRAEGVEATEACDNREGE